MKQIDTLFRRFDQVLDKNSKIEFTKAITPIGYAKGATIVQKGGYSPGLFLLTKGICKIDGETFSGMIRGGSMVGGTCLHVDPSSVLQIGTNGTKLSKSQKRNAKEKAAKLTKWLARPDCKGLFNVPSRYTLSAHTKCSGFVIPARTVLRASALEKKFNDFLQSSPEQYTIPSSKSLDAAADAEAQKGSEDPSSALETSRAEAPIHQANEGKERHVADEMNLSSMNNVLRGVQGVDTEGVLKALDNLEDEECQAGEDFDFDPNNVTFSWEKDTKGTSSTTETKENSSSKTTTGSDAKSSNETKLTAVFKFFDKDGDGYWSLKEASEAQMATEGVPMMEDEFAIICDMLDADASKGMAREHVWRLYLDPEFKAQLGMSDEMISADTIGKDYKIVLGLQKAQK
mmetsp:Transcript_10757/g.20806  ORF Transcript_10757/g.20806 Transcript_10757/m.20806 type:complete len:401 (+) Transcript_10757:390-1592(+)